MSISIFATLINALYEEIRNIEFNLKVKYYEIGMYLKYSKCYCKEEKKSFIDFVNKTLKIKSISQINKYILFYKICRKYQSLITCKLTFTDILSNRSNIEEYLSNCINIKDITSM